MKAPRKQKDAGSTEQEKPQDVKVYVPQRNCQFSGFIRPRETSRTWKSLLCACARGGLRGCDACALYLVDIGVFRGLQGACRGESGKRVPPGELT